MALTKQLKQDKSCFMGRTDILSFGYGWKLCYNLPTCLAALEILKLVLLHVASQGNKLGQDKSGEFRSIKGVKKETKSTIQGASLL